MTVHPQLVRNYDNYLLEDLGEHRIYISFENGLRNILHVPNDWKSTGHEYQKIISKVREDEDYRKFRAAYLEKCKKPGAIEKTFSEPQADLFNQALLKIDNIYAERYRKDEKSFFRVNHPGHIRHSIFSARGLDPDLTGVFKPLEKSEAFAWPMIVHTGEMKDSDAALDLGQDAPQAISKGEDDPPCKHHSPSRKSTKNTSDTDIQEIPNQSNKCEMSSDISTSNRATRTSLKTSPSTGDFDNQQTAGARPQCVHYLLEMLKFSIIRSHAFLALVDRDHLQLIYADRSSIVTTSIVNLNTSEGEAMFLAMLIAFHRLTPKQWGFLPLVDNSFTSTKGDGKPHYDAHISKKYDCLRGLEFRLHWEKDEEREYFSLKLGTNAYHQPGIIGRGTCVAGHWALNHIPNILYSQDFDLHSEESVPQTKLANLFEGARTVNGEFRYEIRELRVTVQEKLYKISLLPTLKNYAQVFYDILQCHRWLYDHVLILHRDISFGNIMYHIHNGQVYGVLNDFDLSSLCRHGGKRNGTCIQRTGTPPYMAIELLEDSENEVPHIRHLYRHDLESLTYVILMLSSRNKFDPETKSIKKLPEHSFSRWFDANVSWHDLGLVKRRYITKQPSTIVKDIDTSFKDFLPWLALLSNMFRTGLLLKDAFGVQTASYNLLQPHGTDDETKSSFHQALRDRGLAGPTTETETQCPFNDETLDDMVRYSRVLGTMSTFAGEKLEKRSRVQRSSH